MSKRPTTTADFLVRNTRGEPEHRSPSPSSLFQRWLGWRYESSEATESRRTLLKGEHYRFSLYKTQTVGLPSSQALRPKQHTKTKTVKAESSHRSEQVATAAMEKRWEVIFVSGPLSCCCGYVANPVSFAAVQLTRIVIFLPGKCSPSGEACAVFFLVQFWRELKGTKKFCSFIIPVHVTSVGVMDAIIISDAGDTVGEEEDFVSMDTKKPVVGMKKKKRKNYEEERRESRSLDRKLQERIKSYLEKNKHLVSIAISNISFFSKSLSMRSLNSISRNSSTWKGCLATSTGAIRSTGEER